VKPDYDIYTRNKDRNKNKTDMLEANEMKVLRKIVGKTKIDSIKPTNQRNIRYPTY
jgi:hypothetical protein